MNLPQKDTRHTAEIRGLTDEEVGHVAGGALFSSPVFPDRTVQCGTMTILDSFLRIFRPRQ
jgi:hypothetical protein